MRLLAIETATEACSAALHQDGETRARFEVAPRGHAARILPMVRSLLAEADIALSALDALAFGRGPGAFTGVRIATSVIQGLALGADRPVMPVSTLAALARGVVRERGAGHVLAAIDARMQQVYWGEFRYTAGRLEALGEERVCGPAEVTVVGEAAAWAAGTGWSAHGEALAGCLPVPVTGIEGERLPQAVDVALLAAEVLAAGEAPLDAAEALPVYLRDRVAEKPRSAR